MKLTTLLLLALAILPLQLLSQNDANPIEFKNCFYHDHEFLESDGISTEIEFSVRQINIFEMKGTEPDPQFVRIELVPNENIDSIKCLAFDVGSLQNVELLMLDDGLNGDVQANDNIYSSSMPIQLAYTYSIETSGPFRVHRSKVHFEFHMNDGSIEKYSTRLRTYFFTEDGYNQFQEHVAKNSVTQVNDSTYYSSNIIHIVSDNKSYSGTSIDYDVEHFRNLDEVMGEDYGKEEILIYLSYNDIDKETGGVSASYWNGTTNYIRTKSLSHGLLNHETLHEWVGSGLSYDLTPNSGHWGFIKRSSSAFGSGCYNGVFQDYSMDPTSGLLVGKSDNSSRHFSNLELFLMNRLPIDSVEFPLYFVSGEDVDCSFDGIENGILDSLSQKEFLQRYDDEQKFFPLTDFGDTIEYKTVVLYDERLSDEVIHLLSFEIKMYEEFFAESTRQHCFANTSIFKDSDGDGFAADLDCDDTNIDINPNQVEVPYNGLDDDCDSETLDDDLDQDGFLLSEDCDDTNININPNQVELPYNGLDDDCDSETLDDDLDQDGFLFSEDCDDTNININPNQVELPYNGLDDDCDSETLDDDLDQDGFLLLEDCDDTNININPNQVEVQYNGLDDDCDIETLDDDIDEDGFLLIDDCDDNNADINPNADEVANNGIDEDCDGVDLVTSVHELSDVEIKIYPNPVIDIIFIELSRQLKFSTRLFDLTGKLIFTSTNETAIKVNAIPKGTYLLQIKDEKTSQKVVEKIVVGN